MSSSDTYIPRREYDPRSPIERAVGNAELLIETRDMIVRERVTNPAAYGKHWADSSDAALAARIIGGLLEAGWLPPGGESDLFEPGTPS